jgi:hypothetical protein
MLVTAAGALLLQTLARHLLHCPANLVWLDPIAAATATKVNTLQPATCHKCPMVTREILWLDTATKRLVLLVLVQQHPATVAESTVVPAMPRLLTLLRTVRMFLPSRGTILCLTAHPHTRTTTCTRTSQTRTDGMDSRSSEKCQLDGTRGSRTLRLFRSKAMPALLRTFRRFESTCSFHTHIDLHFVCTNDLLFFRYQGLGSRWADFLSALVARAISKWLRTTVLVIDQAVY